MPEKPGPMHDTGVLRKVQWLRVLWTFMRTTAVYLYLMELPFLIHLWCTNKSLYHTELSIEDSVPH